MPLINKAKRFALRGRNEYIWIPTIAAADGKPSAAEIGAGFWLTGEVDAIDGFSTKTNFVTVGDAATKFMGKIAVSKESDDPSMTFNGSLDGNDVRKVLNEEDRGYLLLAISGITAGAIGELYEVEIGAVNSVKSLTESFKVVVSFSVPSEPDQAFEMPTAVTRPTTYVTA